MAAGAILALLPIQAQKKFIFTPQWTAQAQFAGYYVAKQKLFGNAAVLELMSKTGDKTTTEAIEMIKEAVEKHRAGATPNDDLTLLCLRIKEEN